MSWSEFRQTVNMALSEEDLRTLCFDLNIEYEDLPAQGKEGKVRELIAKMRREGHIENLNSHLSNIRPKINWEEIQLDSDVYYKSDHIVTQFTVEQGEEVEEEYLDEDEGVLDKLETMQESGTKISSLMVQTGELANALSEKMNIANLKLENAKGDTRKKRVIAIGLASDLRDYSIETDSITREMAGFWNSFYSVFTSFFVLEQDELIAFDNPVEYLEQVDKLIPTFESTIQSMDGLKGSIASARVALSNLRGITKPLNNAVRKTDRILSNYEDIVGQIVIDSQDAIEILEGSSEFLISEGYELDEEE